MHFKSTLNLFWLYMLKLIFFCAFWVCCGTIYVRLLEREIPGNTYILLMIWLLSSKSQVFCFSTLSVHPALPYGISTPTICSELITSSPASLCLFCGDWILGLALKLRRRRSTAKVRKRFTRIPSLVQSGFWIVFMLWKWHKETIRKATLTLWIAVYMKK